MNTPSSPKASPKASSNLASSQLPDHTAVRVALWRALHTEVDVAPHVFADTLGAALVEDPHWRRRPDMDPAFSRAMRASIVGRARFLEDLVEERAEHGPVQYVILGAGLDTFVQRRQDLAPRVHVYELDAPATQTWKRGRLEALGLPTSDNLRYVPVNFEDGDFGWEPLQAAGFRRDQPAVVVSAGLSMYLTLDANKAIWQWAAHLAPGSVFAMTFLLEPQLLEAEERALMDHVMHRAREANTPFLSLFEPESLVDLAKTAGFHQPRYVSAEDIYQRYFATRPDGLRAGHAEAFLVATCNATATTANTCEPPRTSPR